MKKSPHNIILYALTSLMLVLEIGDFNSPVGQSSAPLNDNFANAQFIFGNSGSITGSNVNATKETGEPNHAGKTGGKSIWYKYQATSSGDVTFVVKGTVGNSLWDTLLGVYTGSSVKGLTLVVSNDDAADPDLDPWSAVTFTVTAGSTYYIAVDGYNGSSGDTTLIWSPSTLHDFHVNYFGRFPITVGWEGASGSSNQWRTIISYINRAQSRNPISFLFNSPDTKHLVLHVTQANTLAVNTYSRFTALDPYVSYTDTLTLNSGMVQGFAEFGATETFSSRYNRNLTDLEMQVITQKLDNQGHVLSSSASTPDHGYASTYWTDTSFFIHAQMTNKVQTGISITNNSTQAANLTLNLYDSFASSPATPYASTTISVAANATASGTLDAFFPNLPASDPGGNKITEGNLDISSSQLISVTAYRLDEGTVRTQLPVFLGRATGPLPTRRPVLPTEDNLTRAIALESVTLTRDPFPFSTVNNFSTDHRTRIILFAANVDLLPGENASAITAQAVDSQQVVHPLSVEAIAKPPGWDWLTQIVIRLPDDLSMGGDFQVTISLHGMASNKALIRTKP